MRIGCTNRLIAHDLRHAGRPCDEHGNYLDKNAPPPPRKAPKPDDWFPYPSKNAFETADLIYKRGQLSEPIINGLLRLWQDTLSPHNDTSPFADAKDLYGHIDSTLVGDINWQTFNMSYNGPKPATNVPTWMNGTYDVWFRDPRLVAQNMLANPDFEGEIDYAVTQQFEREVPHQRRLQNFMSADWAYAQAVRSLMLLFLLQPGADLHFLRT